MRQRTRRARPLSLRESLASSAVGAFNFNDQFDLAGIVSAAEQACEPVVALISPRAADYSSLDFLHDIFKFFRSRSSVPLYLEVDHHNDLQAIARAIELGVDAVMADFSHLPYEENVSMTASAVRMAAGTPTLVEGEVEHIGTDEAGTTPVWKLADFVSRTGVDLAAPCIGTVHGFDRHPPPLDRDVVSALCKATTALLVAHGADFLSPRDVKELVAAGVAKVNFGPELRVVVHGATLAWYPSAAPEAPDHRLLTNGWTSATKAQVLKRLGEIRAA
jgi:fructose/tagatose bisphosphate aldolase